MSVLLPEKKGISKTLVNFYHKVFPSADERYWRTYKSTIFNEIKHLSYIELRWELIKMQAELESKFTFIWSSGVFGVISAGIFTYGLELATKVIEFGEYYEVYMLSTVYMDFMLMIIFFTLGVSFVGWICAMFMNIPGKKSRFFYGIFIVMLVILILSMKWKHTIIIDFVFLLLNTFCIATLLGTVADLKKQRALIRILIIEDRLKDLENR